MTATTNKDSEAINEVKYPCPKCGNVNEQKYEIPITFTGFQEYKYEGRFRCEKCHTTCEPQPIIKESKPTTSESPDVPDRDHAEFVIRTIKKSVKREDVLVRQVFYTGLSTYTFDPLNLGVMAPTSEGKTYVVTTALKPFPERDVWNIGNMSTKVLVRQKGISVDQDGNPLHDRINDLRLKIATMGKSKEAAKEKFKTIQELDALLQDARVQINLSGKILLFLEPPHHDLWNLLKPILSHDLVRITFPYVDRTDRDGIVAKNVEVKGWPACIFCSARDESAWEVWPEIQSRFLITSPNMSKEKYWEANVLISQSKGLPNIVKQSVIVSDSETQTAKKCVEYLKKQIKSFYAANGATYERNNNTVWIPYGGILSEALPSNKGSDNRVTDRIFSLLNIIAVAKGHLRLKLHYGPEMLVIASLDDLAETLHITQNVTGMPTHKMQFFKETFMPLYNSKSEEYFDGEGKKHVTTSELADYHKRRTGKILTKDAIRQTYLEELENNGYIDKQESKEDRRVKIYWPIVEVPEQKINYCAIENNSRNFFQYSKILLPRNFKKVKKEWLNIEFLTLLNYGIDRQDIRVIDENKQELCICEFVQKYENTSSLIPYFSKGENGTSHKKIFG